MPTASSTQALAEGRKVWGRFDVRIAGRSRMLAMVAALMNLRSRWSGIATGDQALFMTRAAFDATGGFPAQPLMEDIEMLDAACAGCRARPACASASRPRGGAGRRAACGPPSC